MNLRRGSRLYVLSCAVVGAIAFGIFAPSFFELLFAIAQRIQSSPATASYPNASSPLSIVPVSLLGLLIGGLFGNLSLIIGRNVRDRWDKMDTGDKLSLFVGFFAGIVGTMPFMFLFNAVLVAPYSQFLTVALIVFLCSLSIFALQSMEEVLPWYKGRSKGRRRGLKILDTNVIIDGRIEEVARCGFLEGQLYVPGFVLAELQHIADESDPLRRQRGRRGLEVLRRMQAEFPMEVRTHDKLINESGLDVDTRLVRLAEALGADIVTNDFNLNRVAALQNVQVLNVNDLALALKPNVLPKEQLNLNIAREGSQYGQGVGYLEDGTMVVVENGKSGIGQTVSVLVTQVIQTERGRLIFAEIPEESAEESYDTGSRRRRRAS